MELKIIKSISKPKLPKSYAYALKSSQLELLLQEHNIDIHVDLIFWIPQIIGSILEVHYWVPNENIPYPRLYIRAGALPKENVKNAREAMIVQVFPALVEWLTELLQASENSFIQMKNLHFEAININGQVKIVIN